jgi:hypothetical protein
MSIAQGPAGQTWTTSAAWPKGKAAKGLVKALKRG